MPDLTRKESYFYDLPREYIAQYPEEKRAESRLLYLRKADGNLSHHRFKDIPDLLGKNDLLVINTTKVIPARLIGHKETGALVEIFLLNQIDDNTWECLVKPGRKLRPGTKVLFSEEFSALIREILPEGKRAVEFSWKGDFWDVLDYIGRMPLPPYIQREPEVKDKERYQTVYAEYRGSVAAPTAGLHFTEEVISKIKAKGIPIVEVVLQVGLGTFRPVQTDKIEDHQMHAEFCTVPEETAKIINQAKTEGKRIIAIGTTTTRTLESFSESGRLHSGSKWTDLFIYPGKKFQIIDGLITNFHMPESTLLMLVAAFAGYDHIMNAYRTAIREKYRFFSYGDAMLIL